MTKKIIFWGQLKKINEGYEGYVKETWGGFDRKRKESHLFFEVKDEFPVEYNGNSIKNIKLKIHEKPDSTDNAKKIVNTVTAEGTGYKWWEISVPENWDGPLIEAESSDSIEISYNYNRNENPAVKKWEITKQDVIFTCSSSPTDLVFSNTGTLIPIASMKADGGDDVLSCPVVESIILQGIHSRNDIENGIEAGKEYTIKGAKTFDYAITNVHSEGLTLRIENADEIIEKGKNVSSSTTTENANLTSTNNVEDTSNNVETNPDSENNTNGDENQSSGIPFHPLVDEEKEVRDAYNEQYFWKNHPDLVEFDKTIQKLSSYYLRNDKEDHRQIGKKQKEMKEFKSLYASMTTDEVEAAKQFNETELNKRKELTTLMKAVMSDIDKNSTFPEMPYGPADELKSLREEAIQTITSALNQEPKVKGSDLDKENIFWQQSIFAAQNDLEINSIKEKVLSDIKIKRELRNSAAELGKDIKKAKNGNSNDWKETIKKAEAESGRQGYNENKDEVEELKDRLLAISKEDYRKMMEEVINDILKTTETSKNELSAEQQAKIEKFKDPNLDTKELKVISEELISEVNREGWQKWAGKKLSKTQILLKKAQTKITQEVINDLKKIRDEWNKFIYDKNSYKEGAFQKSEKEIKETLNKVDKLISQNQNISTKTDNKIPWEVIIPISLVAVSLIGIAAIVIVRKSRQNKIRRIAE